jgi:glycerol kinase
VKRPAFQETTSLGAAFAAGLAVGFYTLEAVFSRDDHEMTIFHPVETTEGADKRFASWQKAALLSFDLDDLA